MMHHCKICILAAVLLVGEGINGLIIPPKQYPAKIKTTGIRTIHKWVKYNENIANRVALRNQQSSNSNGDVVEPDLFDYFDPLLSPHAYPKGIDASAVTGDNKIKSLVRYDDEEVDDDTSDNVSNPARSFPGDDMGWGNSSPSDVQKKSYQLKKPFGISLPGSNDENEDDITSNKKQVLPPSTIRTERLNINTSTVFDPTLSPHLYTNGIVPDVIIGDDVPILQVNGNDDSNSNNKETMIIGLLLMDHGSRNAASNERLHELAKLYQHQFASTSANKSIRLVVRAAHMEIALPSIEDGLSALLQENVQEIICHPYFLSPGRHVVEDIPQLVNAAIQALSISIPVKTTRPIGSETSIMINAINSLVHETSECLQRK